MNSDDIKNSELEIFAKKFATIRLNKEKSHVKNDKILVYIGNLKKIYLSVIFEKGKDLKDIKLDVNSSAKDFATIISTTPQVVEKREIEIDLSPQTVFKSKKIIICATLPYHREATFEIEVECREKKNPPVQLSFNPNTKEQEKIIVYKDCASTKIGQLTLKCLKKQDENVLKQDKFKTVNLETDLIINQGCDSIFSLQQQNEGEKKDSLDSGESVVFDVIIEPNENTEIGEKELSFECFTKKSTDIPRILLKEKKPENVPELSFDSVPNIVYPIDKSLIMVGTLSIKLPTTEKGKYKRENGCLIFDNNYFYFFDVEKHNEYRKKKQCLEEEVFLAERNKSEVREQIAILESVLSEKNKNSNQDELVNLRAEMTSLRCKYEELSKLCSIGLVRLEEFESNQRHSFYLKTWNVNESKSPICIYFNAFEYFGKVENILEQSFPVIIPMKYKDANVDTEPVPIDIENGEFTVNQYEALPDLSLVFSDSKGCDYPVEFDESNNAEIRIANEIRYSQAMLRLPAGKKFTLKFKNQQKICTPDKSVNISELRSDKDFILIASQAPYCIHNGGKEESIDIKIDWRRLTGGCSSFSISGKIDDESFTIKVFCNIYETISTNWRSLDLGTSAIVLAEIHREDICDIIDTINLTDTERSLEPHKDMISSTIVLHNEKGNDYHDLLLSPERMKYNQATAILPAIKFLVGQTRLPFLTSFKRRGITRLKGEYLDTVELDDNLSPEAILEAIYIDIFSRMGENAQNETKKLILTYPSTYTIEQRNNLKELVLKEFKNLQEQNLDFVAESDAVLAQYLYSKRTSIGGNPLQNGEQILIYDMGAGTLDISYVRIKIENEGEEKNQITKAIVEKRIGIPVAGNYLDYCIFKYLEPYITDKALEQPQMLKKNIQELKRIISDNTDEAGNIIGNVSNITLKEGETISYKDIIGSKPLKEFFQKCSEGVFGLLLGDNWKDENVTFVYSGRGCLFKPLINHIIELSGWTPEPVADSPEEMKLCAARGAIRYVQKFSKNSQHPFEIESFKYYASFGLVYRSYEKDEKTETYKCEMLKSSDDFKLIAKEKLHSFVSGLDIRPEGPLILVQSYLPSDRISKSFNHRHLREDDNDSCYITELFRVFREDLGLEDSDLQNASIDFSIDDFDDTIQCTILNQPLNEHKFSESIENNDNYKNSMWPFNN